MSSLSRNSCAKVFGNWSRGENFRPKKPRGGGGSTKCVQLAFATQSKITGLSVPQTHARSVGVSVKVLHIISKMSGKLN